MSLMLCYIQAATVELNNWIMYLICSAAFYFENQPNYMRSISAPTDETLTRINADWNGLLHEHEMYNLTLMEYAYQISAIWSPIAQVAMD